MPEPALGTSDVVPGQGSAWSEARHPGPFPDQSALPQGIPRESQLGCFLPGADGVSKASTLVLHIAVIVPAVGTIRIQTDDGGVAARRSVPVASLDLPRRVLLKQGHACPG